jgi:hypothetical protein
MPLQEGRKLLTPKMRYASGWLLGDCKKQEQGGFFWETH